MMFSIIIPCKKESDAKNCVRRCRELYYKDREILVIDDLICAGVPAKKRDYGAMISNGDVFAFIDSDAYPARDWLNVASKHITDYALGGVNLLPPDSTLRERIADLVYRNLPFSYRVKPTRPYFVSEMPACNLFVRRDRFFEVGGFGCDCLTGEDTILCQKLGGCLYVPQLVVYHRRRSIYHPLLKQLAIYGYRRGVFFKSWIGSVFSYLGNFIKGVFK